MTTHAQNGSIEEHSVASHGARIPMAEILESLEIIYRSQDSDELRLAEALLIKLENPSLNNQKEGCTRVLKIF